MTSIPSTVIVAAGLVALVLSIGLIASLYFGPRGPKYKATSIMTANELEFFRRLSKAIPEAFVFPQVAMSALMAPSDGDGKRRMAAFRQISQKRVDWAVYSRDMTLLCVVELDDRTHNRQQDALRDAMLASAGIKTLRWESRNKPEVREIRSAVDGLAKE